MFPGIGGDWEGVITDLKTDNIPIGTCDIHVDDCYTVIILHQVLFLVIRWLAYSKIANFHAWW